MLPDPGANDRARRPTSCPTTCSPRATSCTSPATRCCGPARAPPRWPRWTRAREAGMLISVDPASAALLRDDPRSWTARGRSTCCSPTRTSSPRSAASSRRAGARRQAGARRRELERRASRPSPPGRRRSTTCSTRPAPATRSPPASSASGRATARRRWRPGAKLAAQAVAQEAAGPPSMTARDASAPLRLHGQHLPLADGGGGHARPRARGGPRARDRDRQRGHRLLARRRLAGPARHGRRRRAA